MPAKTSVVRATMLAALKATSKKKKTTETSSAASSGMKAKLAKVKVAFKCAATGFNDAAVLEAAHIYPKSWINPVQVKQRLKDYFPVKTKPQRDKLIKLLEGTSNRIILDTRVHKCYDGKAKNAKLGRWDFAPEAKAGDFTIVVKAEHRAAMKKIGVVDGKTLKMPHVNVKLIEWHNKQFISHLPTAGADVSDDGDDGGDDDMGVDPEEANGATAILDTFLDETVRRVTLPRALRCN